MNPLEGIAQLLSLPFRAFGQFIQSLPTPPGLPPLAQILPTPPQFLGLPPLSGDASTTYNNLETWDFIRAPHPDGTPNPKGRMQGMRIHRDAKVT